MENIFKELQKVEPIFFTPSEILIQYPEMQGVWSPQDIGRLFALGLINGRKLARTSIIDSAHVLILFNMRNELLNKKTEK